MNIPTIAPQRPVFRPLALHGSNQLAKRAVFALLLLSPALVPHVLAQSAPAASSDAVNAESPVMLSSFEVTEDKDYGYGAANTTSATRLNTPIVDLSKNISVLTRDLLDDLKVTEFNDALYQSASVSFTSSGSGRVAIRGFENAAPKRNGLGNYGSDESITDTVTMERMEIVKGPSSLLYGSSSPGGLVNYITKKPTSYRVNSLRFMTGSNRSLRTEIDSGGPLLKNVNYRFVAAHDNTDGPGLYNVSERGVIAGSVRWHLTPKTYIMAGAEYVSSKRTSSIPGTGAPFTGKFDANGNLLEGLQGLVFTKFQRDEGVGLYAGPLNHHDTAVTRYDVDFSHEFSDNLKLFVNYNWMENKLEEVIMGASQEGGGGTGPSRLHQEAGLRWPNRIQNSGTAVLNYNFKRDWGDLEIVAGVEYYKFDLDFAYYTLVNQALWQTVNFRTLAGYDQTSFPDTPEKILQDIRDNKNANWRQEFYYQRQQSYHAPYVLLHGYFLDRTLRVMAGVRRDDISISQQFYPMDRSSSDPFKLLPASPSDQESAATTPLLGVSFTPLKEHRGFAVYASYSESLLANEIVNPDGSTLPPETGEGLEVGVKLDFSKRISATLSWFQIERTNLPRLILGTNPGVWESTGLQRSKGVDLDLLYWITPDWQVLASGALVDAIYLSDNSPVLIGTQIGNVPEWSYSLWNKYTFSSGPLKGFYIGGGMISRPGVKLYGEVYPLLKVPGFTRYDLLFGYSTRVGRREYEVGLKIDNITDELYINGQNGFGPARSYMATASVKF